jgi:hypothetical protein
VSSQGVEFLDMGDRALCKCLYLGKGLVPLLPQAAYALKLAFELVSQLSRRVLRRSSDEHVHVVPLLRDVPRLDTKLFVRYTLQAAANPSY